MKIIFYKKNNKTDIQKSKLLIMFKIRKFLARKYFNLSKHEQSNNYPLFQKNTLK